MTTQHAKNNEVKFATLDERGRASLARLVGDASLHVAGANNPDASFAPKFAALTGSLIGSLPQTRAEDIPGIYERARAAAKDWIELGFAGRAAIVRKFVDLFQAEREAILDVVQWENGKSRGSAYEEHFDVVNNCLYYAKIAPKVLRDHRVSGAVPGLTKATVHYVPKGVVGVISPWNYPLTLAISDAVAAMMAGNTIVLKPDSITPYSAILVKALLVKAGMPRDVYQVVVGSGRELGTPMISNSDYMMFTGSTATGRRIAEQAGANLIGFSAELGGKNAMLVRADAPVKRAARGAAKACFSSSGQLCISVERMYIHEDIWDRFVPEFVKVTEAIKLDATFDWNNDMGPLISDDQVEKIKEHLEDAVAKGATVLAGGKFVPEVGPRAFRPTILTDVTPEMQVYGQETFGPMVSLYKVSSDEQALSLVNATSYGLNGVIWSSNLREAEEIAKRFQTGTVNINDGYAAAWGSIAAPSGGFKDSGISHRHGVEGIVKYTDVQTIATQRLMHIAAPKMVGEKLWANAMTTYLKIQQKLRL